MQICGEPGLEDCSGCGGALCGLNLGKRKCGGPNCDGVVPVSQKAAERAAKVKEQLDTLPSRLQESKIKAGLQQDIMNQLGPQRQNLLVYETIKEIKTKWSHKSRFDDNKFSNYGIFKIITCSYAICNTVMY